MAKIAVKYLIQRPSRPNVQSIYEELLSCGLLSPLNGVLEGDRRPQDGTKDFVTPEGINSIVKHFLNQSGTYDAGMMMLKAASDLSPIPISFWFQSLCFNKPRSKRWSPIIRSSSVVSVDGKKLLAPPRRDVISDIIKLYFRLMEQTWMNTSNRRLDRYCSYIFRSSTFALPRVILCFDGEK